jgi:hypothetical protein
MKLNFLTLVTSLSLFSGATFATEYIYRDLMANTLLSPRCEAKTEAVASAAKPINFDRHSKKFCQTQGYGWHLTEVKNTGNSVCEECSDKKGKYRCRLEDVVVQCKRLKPGTAGLIPGKS